MANPTPWVKFDELSDNGGQFVVSPLSRGMGTTIGNALRRVLLSSLRGTAITAVKIDGVEHEFSTIPNVVEDVIDIICNLKGVVFAAKTEGVHEFSIEFNGKGSITAKDIKTDADVKVINPDHHIAEVTVPSKIKMRLVVESGVGYVPAEANKKENQDINTINIDASFSPITRVNHSVENIRVGKDLDHDSLTLQVWTNGSVQVEDAVREGTRILVSMFGLFGTLNEKPEVATRASGSLVDSKDGERKQSASSLTIDDLELSARSSNCLKRAGIETVSQLLEKSLGDLIEIKNFGAKSAEEIDAKLKQYGLSLRQTEAIEG